MKNYNPFNVKQTKSFHVVTDLGLGLDSTANSSGKYRSDFSTRYPTVNLSAQAKKWLHQK